MYNQLKENSMCYQKLLHLVAIPLFLAHVKAKGIVSDA